MDANLDIRTLNTLGAPYSETFSVSPDVPGHPHTIRHALTPLYSYDALGGANGTYSWMLLGDDDTVWNLPAVLRLLNERGLDAGEPHMLGDFQYHCVREHFECTAPVAVDPRCAPCPAGVAYCPCRLPPGCTRRGWNYGECPYKLRASPYGGAGLIFSMGMLKLLARDPHFYFPLALDTVVPEATSGDVALAEGARLLGYGFTNLLPAAEAARVAVGSPKQNITRRFFAPHCGFNDARSPAEHLCVLQDQAARDPAAFRTAVSVHARQRIMYSSYHDLMLEVLPAYRGLVALLLRLEGEGGVEGASGR
ncbi:hypothetical protein HXX76_013552 [Chlamydomonas incerta]|uniref:Hexosyltransferase n=1 Tax=Chlamydomonas incerta TaxID=51695 RepID=A0A835VS30_CHLIN|nr:hypothetical protein HXX76_013552 [Chlamydomonas incerta]|eukprot:KAG2425710.1 hypothetical protein HXX76_013552 [Chlamydomonas incerta]